MYALAADLHLGGCLARGKGIDDDWKQAVNDLTGILREEKVTDLFLAGDSTELERVTGDELAGLKKLIDAVDRVWYIRGNHDGPPAGRVHVLEVLGGTELERGTVKETPDGIKVAGCRSLPAGQFRAYLENDLPGLECDILMLHQKESKVYSLMPDFDRGEIPETAGLTLCGDIHVRDMDDRFLSPGPLVPGDIQQVRHAGYVHLYDPERKKVTGSVRTSVRPVRQETVTDENDLEQLRKSVEGVENTGIDTPYIIAQCVPDYIQSVDRALKELPHKVDPTPPEDGLDYEEEGGDAGEKNFGEDTGRMFEEVLENETVPDDLKQFSADLVRSGTRTRRKELIKEHLEKKE